MDEVIKIIDGMIMKIEALNQLNHYVGVQDILKKGEVDDNEKNIKIIYESELYILRKLKDKLLADLTTNKKDKIKEAKE